MYLTVLIPDFQLQTSLRAHDLPPERPVALLNEVPTASAKQRGRAPVLQATPAALAYGISPGITATQALARCPHVVLLYRDHEEETLAHADLLSHADSISPDYESTAPGVITIHCHPSATHRPELMDVYRSLTHATRFVLRLGVAANPDLAFLTASQANPIHTLQQQPESIRQHLSALPISLLAAPLPITEVLELWGIRTLGEFTSLAKQDVVHRLGVEAGHLWDFAAGQRQRLLRLVRPTVDFTLHTEMDYLAEQLEPLLLHLHQMLQTLLARLTAAWLVAEEIHLTLRFDNATQHQRILRIAQPTRDLALLMRLLHTALESHHAPAPITAITLQIKPARPNQAQTDLFQPSLRDPNRLAETLTQLEAILGGPQRVGTPQPHSTHKPDTFHLAPFNIQPHTTQGPPLSTPRPLSPPLRRYRPPLTAKVTLLHGIPHAIHSSSLSGNIIDTRGPWHLSGDWWDARQRWAVEEWDIQLHTGHLLRLTRKPPDNWEIDGLYS